MTFVIQAAAVSKAIPAPAASTLSTQDGVNAVYAGLPDFLAAVKNQTRSGMYELAAASCQPISHGKTQPSILSAANPPTR